MAICLTQMAAAQHTGNTAFQKLGIADGLRSNSVTSLLADSRGYLWIGTYQGLNRYDGYQVKSRFPESGDPQLKEVFNQPITALEEDAEGRIWIECESGAYSLYDTKRAQFSVSADDLLQSIGIRCKGKYKVKVGDNDPVTVFKKDYKNFQTINGMKKANGETVNMKGIKIQAPVGTPIEVYIDNRTRLNDVKMDSVAGTTNGMAVYVDIPDNIIPELDGVELEENAVAKYIGIEDILKSDTKYSEKTDNDYNDIVLAVVGNPDVPQEKVITNDEYVVKTCRAKRYLIEDLGATDDFDFNDVVVDVEENTVITHNVTYENGVLKTDEIVSETPEKAKAVIRAMGGTIDFELVIGNTVWSKSGAGFDVKTMYNTQQGTIDHNKVLAEFEVEGWSPNVNNVSIRVNGKDGKVFTISFPKEGTAPMIIAVDPTQHWMYERQSVPSSWFFRNKSRTIESN